MGEGSVLVEDTHKSKTSQCIAENPEGGRTKAQEDLNDDVSYCSWR